MGLLVAFGDDANFVVSVGGFHPRFTPPPLPFPSPERIAVSMLNTPGADPRRGLLRGHLQHRAVRRARRAVLRLRRLQRPGPPRLRRPVPVLAVLLHHRHLGVALGEGLRHRAVLGGRQGITRGPVAMARRRARLDLAPVLGHRRRLRRHLGRVPEYGAAADPDACRCSRGELDKDDNWRALPPPGSTCSSRCASIPEAEAALVLHPVGALRITQRALPLDLTLDKVGTQKPSDVNRLSHRRDRRRRWTRRAMPSSSSRRRSSRTSPTPTSSRSRRSRPSGRASTCPRPTWTSARQ